jgi:hypothetical protein
MKEKDIGVTVSNTLKPSAECARAARTAQSVLSQISRAFHYRDRHRFMRLSAIRSPTPRVFDPVLAALDSNRHRLLRVQKRAVKMVSGL